jgi:class 3 adenylate cyclase
LASDSSGLVNRFVIGVDVEKYSARNLRQQDETQHALDGILAEAADAAGLDRQQWLTQPGGDGELAILPADVDLVATVSGFVGRLDDLLAAHNEDHSDAMKIRLRVAMHMDMVLRSAMGYAGPGLVVLSRLLDGKEFKDALAESSDANLALLVSEPVYHSVVETGLPGMRPGRFRLLTIDNPAKGFTQPAYLYIPGPTGMTSGKPAPAGSTSAAAEPGVSGTGVSGPIYQTTVTGHSASRDLYISGRDLYVGRQGEAGD